MATAEERLMEWLRDAHAMEEQAEQMLSSTAGRLQNYPELRAELERHCEETRQQAAMVRSCIERRGGSTSSLKDIAGKVTAIGQGLSGMFVGDEVVKAAMASYTFEQMEIASYKTLIATAEIVGDNETKRVCEEILRQEESMASWLDRSLGAVTRDYLAREATPEATAKH